MSSVVLKLTSLLVKTLSKPIAVNSSPQRSHCSADRISRIVSKLKRENTSGSDEFAFASLKASTGLTCGYGSVSYKIPT